MTEFTKNVKQAFYDQNLSFKIQLQKKKSEISMFIFTNFLNHEESMKNFCKPIYTSFFWCYLNFFRF